MEIEFTSDERRDAQEAVKRALAEDIGSGDITSTALIPGNVRIQAKVVTRQDCVVAGLPVACMVFREVAPDTICTPVTRDGASVRATTVILMIEGCARAILAAERPALNFLQRLSGIATLTRRFVEMVRPYGVVILDTRKTTPGLRRLEKYAVRCGGGCNHRVGLFDRVLIKDNHRRLLGKKTRLGDAVMEARRKCPGVPIEIEVETESELLDALGGYPDWVLLDNMPLEALRTCVRLCKGKCRVEASGGVTLENVAAVAATGVDAISVGQLTHSAPAVDLALEIC
ncbi:MAG: carboxylating nicotinate-nucleotide diphosphorylase [Kiritimatiellae bacterium]|nr:carboxylating nicotinate-nucleotide diphosphorylase [Kiritimatiellia bacterium]